jgi:hypothetical protein
MMGKRSDDIGARRYAKGMVRGRDDGKMWQIRDVRERRYLE